MRRAGWIGGSHPRFFVTSAVRPAGDATDLNAPTPAVVPLPGATEIDVDHATALPGRRPLDVAASLWDGPLPDGPLPDGPLPDGPPPGAHGPSADPAAGGELAAVCAALARADAAGEPVVLATVVRVQGSAYRRPGARMVIDGTRTVGLLSGGCFEADLAERARGVLASGRPEVVVYDTAGADEVVWGLGLGCDGVVSVLLTPLAGRHLTVARALHDHWRTGERRLAVVTVIGVGDESADPASGAASGAASGTWRPAVGDQYMTDAPDGVPAAWRLVRFVADARAWLPDATVKLAAATDDIVRAGRTAGAQVTLPGGVTADVLVEVLTPPPALLVCGGGPDAQPVVAFAAALGWRVTVVDHRAGFADAARFPGAAAVHHVPREASPGDVVALGPRTTAVVMSHDYARDLDYLDALVAAGAGYVGLLGPVRRRARLWADLVQRRGWPADTPVPPSVHGPAGLDLGGDGPAAIALAIVAEVAAVHGGRAAGALRERRVGIHDEGATPRREAHAPPVAAAVAVAR